LHNSVAMGKYSSTSAAARAKSVERQRSRAIRKILKQQRKTDPVIPRASFGRVVRELSLEFGDYNFRVSALQALQVATEEHMTEMFNNAARLALYNNRDTVVARDVLFVTSQPVPSTREDVQVPEASGSPPSSQVQVQ
jgi:histone H3/H4